MREIKLGIAQGLEQNIYLGASSVNQSIIATGVSGMGKTYALQRIEENIAAAGGCVVVLNFNGTHLNLPLAENIIHIDCYEDGLPFPVLCQYPRPDDSWEDADDATDAIVDVFVNTSRIQVRQKAVLRQAIMVAMSKNGSQRTCSFRDIGTELRKREGDVSQSILDRYYAIFKKVKENEDARCLRGGSICVLDLEKFAPAIQNFVAELSLSSLWRCFRIWGQQAKTPLFVVCDEFQALTLGIDSVLSQILREGRKYNMALLLATQTLSPFKAGQVATVMQAATRLFFKPVPSEIKKVARYTGADNMPKMERHLRELRRGECIATGCFRIGALEINRPIQVKF